MNKRAGRVWANMAATAPEVAAPHGEDCAILVQALAAYNQQDLASANVQNPVRLRHWRQVDSTEPKRGAEPGPAHGHPRDQRAFRAGALRARNSRRDLAGRRWELGPIPPLGERAAYPRKEPASGAIRLLSEPIMQETRRTMIKSALLGFGLFAAVATT
jgi:hypothetical protein